MRAVGGLKGADCTWTTKATTSTETKIQASVYRRIVKRERSGRWLAKGARTLLCWNIAELGTGALNDDTKNNEICGRKECRRDDGCAKTVVSNDHGRVSGQYT